MFPAFTLLIGLAAVILTAWVFGIAAMWIRVIQCRRDGSRDPWYDFYLKDRGSLHIHGPNTEWSAEWSIFKKQYNFGWGFVIGRNGSESDIGLDVHLGRFFNLYLRARFPWTKIFRVRAEKDYEVRHYGINIHPYRGCVLRIEVGTRNWALHTWFFTGITRHRDIPEAKVTGMVKIPMTEGVYDAMWTRNVWVSEYQGHRLGWVRDKIFKPTVHRSFSLDIVGGIPVEGKGENSWDCGMDGVFGTSGKTVEDAVANCVRSVTRMRNQYGGPHDLPRAMTVKEAGEYKYGERSKDE